MASSERQQPTTRVDARIAPARGRNVGREDARTAPDVQDVLARAECEQVENRWNGETTMVMTSVRANPTGIPRRNRIPTAAGSA
jgi:hypothetical protein